MAQELEKRGYAGYRIADAASVRLLLRGPVPVGQLGAILGVSRQAARKVARTLELRGYAITRPDPGDARKVNVVLTDAGLAYAGAVVEVINRLNRELARHLGLEELVAADAVLRAVIEEDRLKHIAEEIPPPRRRSQAVIS